MHAAAFHGVAGRSDEWSLAFDRAFLGNGITAPLQLRRSHRLFPDISNPFGALVVTDSAAVLLREFPGIELRRAVVDRLVNLFFQKGDMSFYGIPDQPQYSNPTEMLSSMSNELHLVSPPPLFELVVARNSSISRQADGGLRQVVVEHDHRFGKDRASQAMLSESLLVSYPIQLAENGYVLAGSVYDRISQYIDVDYFSVVDFQL